MCVGHERSWWFVDCLDAFICTHADHMWKLRQMSWSDRILRKIEPSPPPPPLPPFSVVKIQVHNKTKHNWSHVQLHDQHKIKNIYNENLIHLQVQDFCKTLLNSHLLHIIICYKIQYIGMSSLFIYKAPISPLVVREESMLNLRLFNNIIYMTKLHD